MNLGVGVDGRITSPRRMTQVGKAVFVKVTQPWESNPGPTPIRGELATLIVSVGLKKLYCVPTGP